jgi:hypothetical protein
VAPTVVVTVTDDLTSVTDFADKILAAAVEAQNTCVVEAPPVVYYTFERRVTCPHCTYTVADLYGDPITGAHLCERNGHTFHVIWGRTYFGGL